MSALECCLCGTSSREAEVAPALIRWREPGDRLRVDPGDRCRDRAACRRRVESAGRMWPVLDAGERREEQPR